MTATFLHVLWKSSPCSEPTHILLSSRAGVRLTGAEMATAFKAAYRDMCQLIDKHEPPFIARVTATGHVAEIEGYKQIVDRIQQRAATGERSQRKKKK